ncbi:uncharacterized protein LOC144105688 [Amblyomma americanum]
MSISGCSGTSGNASTEVAAEKVQRVASRAKQEQGLQPEGREECAAEIPVALLAPPAESPQGILNHAGNPPDHVQEPQFESSCSQRWHQRVTAALCVAGVALSFVILALGLLFGGGLRRARGSHNKWKQTQLTTAAVTNETSAATSHPKTDLPRS